MDKELLLKVAKLSKLKFTDEELSKFEIDFKRILEYMEQLKEVDTEGIEPYMTPVTEHLRNDEVNPKQSLDKKTVLNNSQNHDDNFFVVPKVGVK